MIALTEELRRAMMDHPDEPVRLVDPATQQSFVLVRAELFERLQALLSDGDWAEGARAATMEVFARDGWDDPRMDVYDALDPRHDR